MALHTTINYYHNRIQYHSYISYSTSFPPSLPPFLPHQRLRPRLTHSAVSDCRTVFFRRRRISAACSMLRMILPPSSRTMITVATISTGSSTREWSKYPMDQARNRAMMHVKKRATLLITEICCARNAFWPKKVLTKRRCLDIGLGGSTTIDLTKTKREQIKALIIIHNLPFKVVE